MHSPNRRRSAVVAAIIFSSVLLVFLKSALDNAPHEVVQEKSKRSSRRSFTAGSPEPHREYRKALIIASVEREDTNWTSTLPANFDVYRYMNDNPEAEFSVPLNKGNEVMSYLTYLIDHYDHLPEVMVFVHAHEFTHHNPWILGLHTPTMVTQLSPQRVIREGYINLHCGSWDEGDCSAAIRPHEGRPWEEFRDIWQSLFPHDPVPEVLAQHNAGQFAISRERALQIPQNEYIRLRQWMMDTEMNLGITGNLWEYLWQVIFTGKNVYCPDMHVCYCDGFGYCFEDDAEFSRVNRLFIGIDKLSAELRLSQDRLKSSSEAEEGKQMEEAASLESEKQERMRAVMRDMSTEVWSAIAKAQERGKSPEIRAQRSRRDWKQGDGFN